MAQRRSTRLKEKEEQRTWRTEKMLSGIRKTRSHVMSTSEEEEGGEEDNARETTYTATPSSRRITPQKPNNYTKVYSSYNRDYGLDVYEEDFIDDQDTVTFITTPTKPSRNKKKKKRKLNMSTSSSSDCSEPEIEREAPRKLILSSDEEGAKEQSTTNDLTAGSDDEEIHVKRGTRKRYKSHCTQLSSSSEEEDSTGRAAAKVRRLKRWESDEEIESVASREGSSRAPSSRATNLKEEKKKRSEEVLKKLRECREDSKADNSSPVEEAQDFFDDLMRHSADSHGRPEKLCVSLAERILFPSHDDSEDTSDEDSDWIVSDGDECVDWKEMLRQTASGDAQVNILYHPEEEEVFVTDKELEEILSSPLIEAVCGDGGVEAVKRVIAAHSHQYELDAADDKGYTGLMHAVDRGDSASLGILIEAGASIDCKDDKGTTPLHLAALSGWLECLETLISNRHEVDCRDDRGWPPLLYAHFQDHQDCVLALMKAKPQQLSVLGDLLKQSPHSGPEKSKNTLKVIRSLLMSLAHEEAYYSLFNSFIHCHPSVLEEDGFGFLKHCMRLLSFENKQAWLKRKLSKLRDHASVCYSMASLSLCNIPRDGLLNCVLTQLRGAHEYKYWLRPLHVTFKGEHGIGSGPRKEFFSCLVKSLACGEEKLFCVCDDGQLSLQPYHVLFKYNRDVMNWATTERHDKLLELVAMVVAHAVFHGETIDLHLTNPMIKQILGIPLEHPADMEAVDKVLHHCISQSLDRIGEIEELDLTFTHTLICPWTKKTADLPLCEGGRAMNVQEHNKHDFAEYLSQFKLEECIKQELKIFTSAFWKIIPQKCLEVFTPSELVLLISGIPEINVEDWQKNTRYCGLNGSESIVMWFWKLVRSLKEEEKALLLKFSTGSPCVPAGGFASLQGLSGTVPFSIGIIPGMNKVPQAATCFNTLKLTDYSSEQQFRNKILIAIRYGCEGFEFS